MAYKKLEHRVYKTKNRTCFILTSVKSRVADRSSAKGITKNIHQTH